MSFAKIASKLVGTLTGGLADTLYDAVKTYFPPDMPLEDKARIMLQMERIEMDKRQQANNALLDAERLLTERISQLEGTANDLKSLPFVGRFILFARGCQRPVWGFFTLWLDYQWFSAWTLNEQQQSALIAINILVLGFLFGERAAQNIMPYVIKALQNRAQ